MRERRRGRVAAVLVDHHLHAVGRQYFERAGKCRLGERVRVGGQKQRAVRAVLAAVLADSLGDRQDVVLVEGGVEGRSAMAGGSKAHLLGRIATRPDVWL